MPDPTASRLARNLVAGVAMMIVSTVVAVLGCELLVRTIRPQLLYRYPQGLYVNDADLGYRLAPGFRGTFRTPEYTVDVAVNRQGLREDRDYGAKPDGTFRILVIGDSFTMGHSVDAPQTFVKVLERLLNDRTTDGTRYEVINAGVPGYNTFQEVAYLRRDGLALQPDLVILAFFIGNDIRDNAVPPDRFVVRDGYLVDRTPSSGLLPESLRLYLSRHSHLYHLAWPYQRALLQRGGLERLRREALDDLSIYAADQATPANAWQRTRQYIREFAELCGTRRKTSAAVVLLPDLVQVKPSIAPVAFGAAYDVGAPDERVLATARDLGLQVLDLLPVLQSAPTPDRLYFPIDRHFTTAGNALTAKAIAEFLVAENLVPLSATPQLVERRDSRN